MADAHEVSRSRRVRSFLLFAGIPLVSMSLTFVTLYLCLPQQKVEAAPTSFVEPALMSAYNATPALAPVRLQIGTIQVDTLIKPVGLTSEGDMAIDSSIDTTAWYQLGPKPGEKGSAVIAGHYGWTGTLGSVFNNLHTLKKGDSVVVYDEQGEPIRFIVREIRKYHPEDDATEVFKSNDGKAHLNLITCEGAWNNAANSYTERLVVFTDLE